MLAKLLLSKGFPDISGKLYKWLTAAQFVIIWFLHVCVSKLVRETTKNGDMAYL